MMSSSKEGMRNNSSRRRMLPGWRTRLSISGFPEVTEAAHRADAYARGLDFCAQTGDVNLNRVRGELRVVIGQLLGYLFLAQHTAGARHEELKQGPLPHRQLDRRAVDPDAFGLHVDGEAAHGNRAR